MNKTDRQLAILLELQHQKVVKAEQLAQQFEISIRTIYRDIQALCEAGVPIIGAPGQGYLLMDGYFLPPVGFTAQEAVALLVGMDFIQQSLEKDYSTAAMSAKRKVQAVLPEAIQAEARLISDTMKLIKHQPDQAEKEALEQIRASIIHRNKIGFHYMKSIAENDGNRATERTADPYGLTLFNGNWVVVAYCDLRKSIRHFRLSRMTKLHILGETFAYPKGFNLQQYTPQADRDIEIVLQADPNIIDKIKEQSHFYLDKVEHQAQHLLVYFKVRQVEELLPHVLGWGSKVEVIQPLDFRKKIKEEILKMLKRY
ncbi:YafY family protein [Paenibacillus turicensis]|uniref:helix-turn-helix transcriptional regulator n=1 Tax=Paenibacillus turicensis TaxID=160487 RepID=UPI003D2ABC47